MVNNYLISGGVTARQISTTFTDTETTHVPKKLVCFSSYTEKWSKITLLTHVLSQAVRRLIVLAFHFRINQSARPKSTIYLCGIN